MSSIAPLAVMMGDRASLAARMSSSAIDGGDEREEAEPEVGK